MKKTIIAIMAILSMLPAALATTIIFNATNGTVTVTPPALNLQMRDWNVIYHLDNSTAGRNSVAPGYEYQYAGEVVHFNTLVASNSNYATDNMNVTVNMNCLIAGIQTTTLTRISQTTLSNGLYEAQFGGDYTIPTNISEDCILTLSLGSGATTKTINISSIGGNQYWNVDELLMNPTITLTESGALSFNLLYNSYANGNPFPQIITITTPIDKEGQGITGDMLIYKTKLVGQTQPTYSITPDNYRYSLNSATWNFLNVDTDGNGYSAPISISTGPSSIQRTLYWQLYMNGNLPSQQYMGTGWYQIRIL